MENFYARSVCPRRPFQRQLVLNSSDVIRCLKKVLNNLAIDALFPAMSSQGFLVIGEKDRAFAKGDLEEACVCWSDFANSGRGSPTAAQLK